MWGYPRQMQSPARIQREAKELSETLREALQRAVERSGVDLKELAARVGRADGYFSHLFKGRITLTVEHIFVVLLALGLKPAEFFGSIYGTEGHRDAEDDFDVRVLRAMERYGIRPRLRDESGGAAAL
jgi:transcriptional regulator with XRE-family HTH domain